MPNPYIELFRKKHKGEITQEELEKKIKELEESGTQIKDDDSGSLMVGDDIDWAKDEPS